MAIPFYILTTNEFFNLSYEATSKKSNSESSKIRETVQKQMGSNSETWKKEGVILNWPRQTVEKDVVSYKRFYILKD